jgi:ATP-dependent helicase/nuclease subunit B
MFLTKHFPKINFFPELLTDKVKFFNIPGNYSFLESLYRFIVEKFGDGIDLSSIIIFLPSRRSANELKRVFIDKKKLVFTPTIRAIGDIDYDDIITSGADANILKKMAELTRPVSSIKYKLLLLEEFLKEYNMAQSINLADDLNAFLNEVEKNNCDLDALEELTDENYSIYWQDILKFLCVFLKKWRGFLAENNIVSPNNYRVQTIKYYMESFNGKERLDNPVIVAGNLMTINTTIDLVESLKKFDNSYFIFKGFDSDFGRNDVENIEEINGNYYFYNFIDKIKIEKIIVKNIEYAETKVVDDNCKNVLNYSSLPYQLTNLWGKTGVKPLENIECIECENICEEMKTVAFYILDFIEKNSMKNIAVISDINDARELEIFLRQYGLPINNTFGKSFSAIELSKLLILLNNLVTNNFRKDIFLSFLKNPRVKYSKNINIIKALEDLMLDKPVNAVNLEGYIMEAKSPELIKFLKEIRDIFSNLSADGTYLLREIIDKEFKILEKVVLEREINTENNQKIVDYLLNFREESDKFNMPITVEDYNILLKYFLNQQSYSEEFSVYPAVNIIKAEEARLIDYSLVVIFNCNDGFFPVNIPNDPWLNNSMRKKIGLMVKSCEIGRAHYDFIQLLSQRRVLITRSVKVDDKITFKSRFLQRLESFLKCEGLELKVNEEIINAVRFDNSTTRDGGLMARRPEPHFNIRNVKKISATNFDMLAKNPYDFYAKYALGLKDVNVITDYNIRAILGTFLHRIFEKLPEGKILIEDEIDNFFYNNEVLKKLYKKRILLIVENFSDLDKRSRAETVKIEAENSYECELGGYNIVLRAQIDRLEFLPDGSANIVDYKTGTLPSKNDMCCGRELQLPFTALIIRQNKIKPNKIDVWGIKSNDISRVIVNNEEKRGIALDEVVKNTEKFVLATMEKFSKEDGKFIATTLNKHSVYEHLSRTEEWVYG